MFAVRFDLKHLLQIAISSILFIFKSIQLLSSIFFFLKYDIIILDLLKLCSLSHISHFIFKSYLAFLYFNKFIYLSYFYFIINDVLF